ncbi:nuclear transport factor 2 family protein [Spirillospora sp. NPDC047279]|uniref:nuclear transport factor 2 family protein n=1 Tax=Spirillospora sp. NPDC047279 TaxID=3155478 RepID=UPI0033C7DEF9
MNEAREVFGRLLACFTEGRWQDLADLYADDVVVEWPMAHPPHPTTMTGRDGLVARTEVASRRPFELSAHNVVVHETADPEVVIAEWDYRTRVTTTGHTFTSANIQVVRVRDGKIVATRDYHDFQALAQIPAPSEP